ncbi:MAG TPA: signal peptidase I [Polyangiaceae bacterium]
MRKLFRLLFWALLVLGVVIGTARATVLRWWWVPTDDRFLTSSISPSVRAGDLLLLWRGTNPRFGDLVMCPEPKRPDRIVIGRIIGEARDSLQVKGTTVTVNRKNMPGEGRCSTDVFTEIDPGTRIPVEQPCSLEEVGGDVHMRGDVMQGVGPSDVDTTVPEDHVWLVSDNRMFPYDSRDFGPVLRETCTEKVFFRLVGSGGYFDVKTRNQFIH